MTPAGTSNELDVQNEWEENTHTHTSTASLFAARHQDAHSEGIISGENEGDPQLRDKHNNRAMDGSSIPAGVVSNFDEKRKMSALIYRTVHEP